MSPTSVRNFLRKTGRAGLPPDGTGREVLFWSLQFAGWSVIGILSVFTLIQMFSPRGTLLILTIRIASGLLVTYGMRILYRRIPWREWSWLRLGFVVIALCLLVGPVDSLATHVLSWHLMESLGLGNRAPEEVRMFVQVMGILLRSSILLIWSLFYFGIKLWMETASNRLRAARSEAAARTSELRRLQAQVNPHFLFNALNSILAEKDNPEVVEKITQELAEYLRFSLKSNGDFQPLGEELDALEHYLRVEKARFEDKFVYQIDATPEARRVRVPVATVQPLIENAMKYGRMTSGNPLRLKLSAEHPEGSDRLDIRVENTGRWVEAGSERSHGIGLSNLRQRLELLYGQEGKLTDREEDGWVKLEVRLPVRPAAEPSADERRDG